MGESLSVPWCPSCDRFLSPSTVTPYGACPQCEGLGRVSTVDVDHLAALDQVDAVAGEPGEQERLPVDDPDVPQARQQQAVQLLHHPAGRLAPQHRAFALMRLQLVDREFFPGDQALLIPLYLNFSKVGLANSHLGLAMVHAILQLPFSIYLMRNSFESIFTRLRDRIEDVVLNRRPDSTRRACGLPSGSVMSLKSQRLKRPLVLRFIL